MNITVSLLNSFEEPAWSDYVDSHPDLTIYHTLRWRDILFKEYGYKPMYFMARKSGLVVGVLPMFLIKNLNGTRMVSLPFSIYGGPLGDSDHVVAEMLSKCDETANKCKASSIEIRSFKHMGDAKQLGFQAVEWGMGSIMDLQAGVDALWKGFSERFNVEKAKKKGLKFFLTDGERLKSFYTLQLMTRKRLGLPTPRLAYYESFFKGLPGKVKLALVEKDGKVIAGDLFFLYGDSVLLALNVSDWRYRNCKPNDFMIWNIIRWSCAAGIKKLDHGPASFQDKGLLHFKNKWGGDNYKVARYYYPHADKRSNYQEGSLLFKAMPKKVAGFLGSRVIKALG